MDDLGFWWEGVSIVLGNCCTLLHDALLIGYYIYDMLTTYIYFRLLDILHFK